MNFRHSGRISSRPSQTSKKTSWVTIPNNPPSFARTSVTSTRQSSNRMVPIHPTSPPVSSPTKLTRSIRVTPTKTSKAPTSKTIIIPEKEVIKAISEILSKTGTSSTFSDVYRSVRNLTHESANEVYEKFEQLCLSRLSEVDISSIENLVNEWHKFDVDLRRIDSFMKFACLSDVKSKYDSLPHWKYKEVLKSHSTRCSSIGVDVWKREVHSRAVHFLNDEIQCSIRSITSGSGVDGVTSELFALLRTLGYDCLEQVKSFFVSELAAAGSDASSKLECIISMTERLSAVFPMKSVQQITVAPYLAELLPPLLDRRVPEPIIALKSILLPENVPAYTAAVFEHLKKVSLPVDYFSLVAFLVFYSSVMFNDEPVKRVVSNFISKSGSEFAQNFVSVIFAHAKLDANLKQLAPLPPLFADKEKIANELVRAFLLRILQKRPCEKDAEFAFAKELRFIFSNEELRGVFSLLRDFTSTEKLTVVNTSLSMPLIANDRAILPIDLQNAIQSEVDIYSQKFINRKYSVSATFTIFYVKAKWPGESEEKLITMSALQFSLIQMISRKSTDFRSTQASVDALNAALKCLIKAKIVTKRGSSLSIAEEPPKERKINVYVKAIDFRMVDRQKMAQSHDHSLSIQSVVARKMKENRKMKEDELTRMVENELSSLFNIRDGDIPKVIEHMIENEFIERDKSNNNVLIYLP